MTLTIEQLMSKMSGALIPEKAAGLDVVIQFKFSGAEAGDWYLTVKDSKASAEKGIHPAPKMTLSADSDDCLKVFSGEMDGMQAFMRGNLQITGDYSLAMQLMQMFKMK